MDRMGQTSEMATLTGAIGTQRQSSGSHAAQQANERDRQYHLGVYQRTKEQLNNRINTARSYHPNQQNVLEALGLEVYSSRTHGPNSYQSAPGGQRHITAAELMQELDIHINPVKRHQTRSTSFQQGLIWVRRPVESISVSPRHKVLATILQAMYFI